MSRPDVVPLHEAKAYFIHGRCRPCAQPTTLMIEIRSVEDPASLFAARSLVRAHVQDRTHDAAAAERVVAALPEPYVAPRGVLWVAWENEEALGCVALQELATDTAELKRMYVRPESRGRGVARRLVEHAIEAASARGYGRLRLGTLTTMRAAQSLYASLGFRRIEPYRPVEFGETWFYERALIGSTDQSSSIDAQYELLLNGRFE